MNASRWARLFAAGSLWMASACAGQRHPIPAEDVSPVVGPPPRAWKAAVALYLPDSTRVEFFDGVRTRVVTSREGMEAALGRTPWYRVHLRDTLATVLEVRVEFPGVGATTVAYPLAIHNDAFYSVRIGVSGYDPRRIIGAKNPQSYPVPAAVQTTTSDSLRIYWAARSRDCWTCPS